MRVMTIFLVRVAGALAGREAVERLMRRDWGGSKPNSGSSWIDSVLRRAEGYVPG
jgi:hypothetical protein